MNAVQDNKKISGFTSAMQSVSGEHPTEPQTRQAQPDTLVMEMCVNTTVGCKRGVNTIPKLVLTQVLKHLGRADLCGHIKG